MKSVNINPLFPFYKTLGIIAFLTLLLLSSCDTLSNVLDTETTSIRKSSLSSIDKKRDRWVFTEDELAYRTKRAEVRSPSFQKLLIQAVHEKDISKIVTYTNKGGNPNAGVNKYAETPIEAAIKSGCYECLDAMESHMDINSTHLSYNRLPLVLACRTSLTACKKLVLDFNANPNAFGRIESQRTGMCNVLKGVLVRKPIEGVSTFLIEQGGDPTQGFEPAWNDRNFDKDILKLSLLDFETFLRNGCNPSLALRSCMASKQYDKVDLLLSYGVHPDAGPPTGPDTKYTALYWAIKHNNLEMVKKLVGKGANIHAVQYSNGKAVGSALDIAVSNSSIDEKIIEYLKNL